MNSPQEDTPAELKGITEVLEKSLRPSKEEEIPPMPDDLRARLKGQYSEEAAQAVVVDHGKEGVWSQLKSLFAQPAFGGALAALVLVGVLMSLLMRQNSKDPAEGMRGTGIPEIEAPTIIILYDLDDEQLQAVTGSGYFDPKHLFETSSETELAKWVAQKGSSIVVDGASGEIRHEDGRQIDLPNANSADAIVELLEKK